jgi:2-oxoglutarate dehydrogenase E1 component
VVNNQIGFTTLPGEARSTRYPTDVAKMVEAPILHVNGDQPEDAVRVMKLALAFRQAFERDVVVDLVCYRRWGHNEADDPSFTNPTLYAAIKSHRSVRKLYTEQLLRRGDIDPEAGEKALEAYRQRLAEVHEEVSKAQQIAEAGRPLVQEAGEEAPSPMPRTAVDAALLEEILDGLERLPADFEAHPKLVRQLAKRREKYETDAIEWALAEALALGSMVLGGTRVRLSGEDSGRGTFSQRHAILYDHRDGTPYVPLQNLRDGQAEFEVYDSLLSEFAVLGFEYGYSVESPGDLVIWEAQFGDFVNGAQVIIDQFIASAEDKWEQESGLVMFLPHGYEGQGPEHSSARIERFLQAGAGHNIEVVYPSSPGQVFHLLRRQGLRRDRMPLVVFTGKSLLRHPRAVAAREELTGGSFRSVIDDPTAPNASRVRRVLLCTGKVYWDLDAHREEAAIDDVAIIRVEQLYPFPAERVGGLLHRYDQAEEVCWVQEEPANMGAWSFVRHEIAHVAPGQLEPLYIGRRPSPSPATGSSKRHQAEQARLVRAAFE